MQCPLAYEVVAEMLTLILPELVQRSTVPFPFPKIPPISFWHEVPVPRLVTEMLPAKWQFIRLAPPDISPAKPPMQAWCVWVVTVTEHVASSVRLQMSP